MILVDTSIWVEHLRAADQRLISLLDAREILGHPFVTGEIALGSLRNRARVLIELQELPQANVASAEEVLHLIGSRSLHNLGIGYVDVHLIAAVRLTPFAMLWTRDRRLHQAAIHLGLPVWPSQTA